jgi:hypothetical protein
VAAAGSDAAAFVVRGSGFGLGLVAAVWLSIGACANAAPESKIKQHERRSNAFHD